MRRAVPVKYDHHSSQHPILSGSPQNGGLQMPEGQHYPLCKGPDCANLRQTSQLLVKYARNVQRLAVWRDRNLSVDIVQAEKRTWFWP